MLLLFISGTKTWNSLSKTELQQQRGNIVPKSSMFPKSIKVNGFCLFLFARHQ